MKKVPRVPVPSRTNVLPCQYTGTSLLFSLYNVHHVTTIGVYCMSSAIRFDVTVNL